MAVQRCEFDAASEKGGNRTLQLTIQSPSASHWSV